MTKRSIATPPTDASSTAGSIPSLPPSGSAQPSDVELAFTNSEFVGMVLTLIQRMATQYDHRNDDGPYGYILDGMTQIACGAKGPVDVVAKKYFRERLEATVRAGLVDHWPSPKVRRRGQILYLENYTPFHEHDTRWVRCSYALTGTAEIQDSEYTERKQGLAVFYCRLLTAEGHDLGDHMGGTPEAQAQHFPCWQRRIKVPARDVLQAPVRMYMED